MSYAFPGAAVLCADPAPLCRGKGSVAERHKPTGEYPCFVRTIVCVPAATCLQFTGVRLPCPPALAQVPPWCCTGDRGRLTAPGCSCPAAAASCSLAAWKRHLGTAEKSLAWAGVRGWEASVPICAQANSGCPSAASARAGSTCSFSRGAGGPHQGPGQQVAGGCYSVQW